LSWRTWRVSTSSVSESSNLKFSRFSMPLENYFRLLHHAKPQYSKLFRLVLQILQVLHAKNMFPAKRIKKK
jgi:hypothetical protein